MLPDFYAASAQISFALLGLWWVVVTFKHQEWVHQRWRRWVAYDLSLFFLLPGFMSLASLMAERLGWLWQVGFAAAGTLGLLATFGTLRMLRDQQGSRAVAMGGRVAAMVLYAMVVVTAILPGLPRDAGIDLTGQEVEAILLSVLLFIGANLVWLLFFEAPEPGSSGPATPGPGP